VIIPNKYGKRPVAASPIFIAEVHDVRVKDKYWQSAEWRENSIVVTSEHTLGSVYHFKHVFHEGAQSRMIETLT
jgi:hypothetical protein